MSMETRLAQLADGKFYYEVCEDGKSLFTGTLDECQRFKHFHHKKVKKFHEYRRTHTRKVDGDAAKKYKVPKFNKWIVE